MQEGFAGLVQRWLYLLLKEVGFKQRASVALPTAEEVHRVEAVGRKWYWSGPFVGFGPGRKVCGARLLEKFVGGACCLETSDCRTVCALQFSAGCRGDLGGSSAEHEQSVRL